MTFILKGGISMLRKCARHHHPLQLRQMSDVCHFIEKVIDNSLKIKRIMSLPDDFIVTGSMSQKIERCGRMVLSLMMKAIESVYENVINHIMNGVKIMSKNYDFYLCPKRRRF